MDVLTGNVSVAVGVEVLLFEGMFVAVIWGWDVLLQAVNMRRINKIVLRNMFYPLIFANFH